MTASVPQHAPRTARAAVVLRPGEHAAEVSFGTSRATVGYAAPFASRAASLTPGHLVAVTSAPEVGELVLWRWFDAVVLEQSADEVRLWEPAHGEVLARARLADHRFAAGTRAYASAGLPGAEWWVEGPVGPVEEVEVALDAVCAFYAEHDLWSRLT